MKAPNIASRVFFVLLSTLALALSGTLAWGTVTDFQSRGIVPQGVRVAETSLGGMTETEARAVIEQEVATPLLRPLTVQADGESLTLDPREILAVDVDGMISDAYALRRQTPFVGRLRNQVAGEPLITDVKPRFAIDSARLSAWISSVAEKTDRPAIDAAIRIEKGKIVMINSVAGRKLDTSATVTAIKGALTSDTALADKSARTIAAVVRDTQPALPDSEFGKAIVVDESERRIWLYSNMKLEKTYRCAVGTRQYPTPKGSWTIVNKRFRPTWRNPGSAWAKDMPPFIAPGPGNPLGTRALDLNASGIRIHGSSANSSIGTAASHGCMRMHMWDIEDLYPRVPVGTPALIVR